MKLAKWGNSLALRLPKDLVEALDLHEGDDVRLGLHEDGRLVVDKTPDREKLIEELRKYRGLIPAEYKFDRDEIYSRD